jgi:ParB/RepB/Spo0J family partition protein
MNALTPLALTSEPLLRAIQAGDFANLSDLATKAGRNKSNMARDLGILEEAGLIARSEPTKPALTPAGLDQLVAIERANPVRVLHGDIERDPLNPRRVFDEGFIAGVAESIFNDGKLDGLLQPLLIRARVGGEKPYRLIAGENRWRAIGKLIAEGRWPVDLPVPHVVRIMSDEEAAVAALIENIQRNDLSAVDEALTFEHLKTTLGWSNADIAAKIKKSPEFVQQRLRVLTLPEEVQARMRLPKTDENRIGFKEARKLFTASREPTRPKAPELSPKLAVALLELAHKIESAPMIIGEPGFTNLTSRPVGGALATLNERKIVSLKEWGGQVFAKILLHSSGAVTFLEDVGFYGPKRDEVIWQARTAIMAPQRASEATRDGRYITPELNTAVTPDDVVDVEPNEAKESASSGALPGHAAQPDPSAQRALTQRMAEVRAELTSQADANPVRSSASIFARDQSAEIVSTMIDRPGAALVTLASSMDGQVITFAVMSEDEGRAVCSSLVESGLWLSVTIHDRSGKLLVAWG